MTLPHFKHWNLIFYLSLAALLLGLDRLGTMKGLRRLLEVRLEPVKTSLRQEYQVSKLLWQGEQNSNQSCLFSQEKVTALEAENLSLKAKVENLSQENEAIRHLLGAPLPPSWQFLPVRIIGVTNQVLVINHGEDWGIKQGEAVVLAEVLVGEVTRVTPKTAQVRLVVHPDFSTQVRVRESQATGKIKVHGERVFLEEVPTTQRLVPDSLVVRQSDGLVIGKVGKIVSEEKESWQTAEVIWPIEIDKIETVFVVKK